MDPTCSDSASREVLTREDRYKQEEYAWLRRMREGEQTNE